MKMLSLHLVNFHHRRTGNSRLQAGEIHRELNGIKKRVVVGLEIDGKLETILVDDIEPAHKAVGLMTNMLGLTMLVF